MSFRFRLDGVGLVALMKNEMFSVLLFFVPVCWHTEKSENKNSFWKRKPSYWLIEETDSDEFLVSFGWRLSCSSDQKRDVFCSVFFRMLAHKQKEKTKMILIILSLCMSLRCVSSQVECKNFSNCTSTYILTISSFFHNRHQDSHCHWVCIWVSFLVYV